jgi:hypothetical protein
MKFSREMNCPSETGKMAGILLEYPTGRLDPVVRAALDRHLTECQVCRDAIEAQTAIWNALDVWEPAPLSMDFNRRLWQKVDQVAAEPWYSRLAGWKPMLPAAITALVLVAATLVFERPHEYSRQSVATEESVSVTEVDQAVNTLDDLQLLQQLDSVTSPDITQPDGGGASRI